MSSKTILITGANKGIGYHTVKGFIENQTESKFTDELNIYLGCRNQELGLKAVEQLTKLNNKVNIKFIKIDLNDFNTILNAFDFLKNNNIKLDILINNAGYLFRDDNKITYEETLKMMNTNYYGTKKVTETMLPLMNKQGRIISLSSRVGRLSLMDEKLRNKFTNKDLNIKELDNLMGSFLNYVKDDTYKEKGYNIQAEQQWRLPYGMSKIGVTVMTSIFYKKYINEILVLCVCPGVVSTDMNNFTGPLPVEEGTKISIYLSLEEFEKIKMENSFFFAENKVWDWYSTSEKI